VLANQERRTALIFGIALVTLWTLPQCSDGGSDGGGGTANSDDAGVPTDGEAPDADGAGPEPDATVPSVAFVAPADGATIPNPVLFEIQAANVDEVEIFADETYSLGSAWDPTERQTLLYRFSGTGTARAIHVTGRVDGQDVVRDDLTITVSPDSCEDRFFVTEFDSRNEDPGGALDLVGIREDALAAIHSAVSALQACGAGVTLGGMMSLLLYEGGFRAGAYNTRCSENSYNQTQSDCDLVAEALYSYQFGIGAIHTSNFHPCKDVAYTQGMRQYLTELMDAAGFDTDPAIVTPELAVRFATVCSSATPIAADYYILGAHDVFSVPKNDAGNYLEGYGVFPFFSAQVSVNLTFRPLRLSCSSIADDRDAIDTWGGGDPTYGDWDKQTEILSLYQDFAAANCP
jgi:hypothetical protein